MASVHDTTTEPERLPHRAPAPEEVVGLLTDDVRRRLVAALVEHPRHRDDLLARLDAPARQALGQLRRLVAGGLVIEDGARYALVDDVFERSVRDAASARFGPLNDEHTRIARRYFFRNRLVQIPSERWALETVLDLIAQDFQPGTVYNEREVNTQLYGWHGDWAALRRMLVDHGHLTRDHGRYWRTGPAPS